MAPLLEVVDLVKHFPIRRTTLRGRQHHTISAVDGVSLTVGTDETLAVVGESGSGKSTVARLVLGLHRPTSGTVRFDGVDVHLAGGAELRAMRRRMQMVFQDPYGSLDPRMTARAIVAEPLQIHGVPVGRRVDELLAQVGLSPEHADRYPHEFSGGQRQRVGVARAIALGPELLVCDEPVSALDVSIRAQILNLLEDLQQELGLAYLFISHDLSVVAHVAHRVAVMYLGTIVETAPTSDLFDAPRHPYTRCLLAAVPVPDPRRERARRRIALHGEPPNPARPPSGCRFRTRCPRYADELSDGERTLCREASPVLSAAAEGHAVACHFPG